MSIFQLNTLRQFLNELKNQNQNSINKYNEIVTNNVDDSMSFIYLHYITKRNDSDFWKNFKNKTVVPKKLQETQGRWSYYTGGGGSKIMNFGSKNAMSKYIYTYPK
jgi:hypothetical protein